MNTRRPRSTPPASAASKPSSSPSASRPTSKAPSAPSSRPTSSASSPAPATGTRPGRPLHRPLRPPRLRPRHARRQHLQRRRRQRHRLRHPPRDGPRLVQCRTVHRSLAALDVIFAVRHRRRAGPARLRIPRPASARPRRQIALDINYDMILPIGVPKEINVNGAAAHQLLPRRSRPPPSASASPSSPTPGPRPALLPLRSLQPLARRHPRLLHRRRHALRRPRPRLGRGPGKGLQRPPLPQLLRQLHPRHGLPPATPSSPASAWTSAGRPPPPRTPSSGTPATSLKPPARQTSPRQPEPTAAAANKPRPPGPGVA